MSVVHLICGKICSGKTFFCQQLVKETGAVVLSCDEVMLAILGEYLGDEHEKYTQRTEIWLLQKSLEILQTGIDVILEWGPWTRAGRDRLRDFYASHGVEYETHAICVDDNEWHRRIEKRNHSARNGAYLVDEGLLNKFLSRYEEPGPDEVDVWVD